MKNNEVMNDLLNYNDLKIFQNKEYFNFSLDSILLANFVKVSNKEQKILDICTGNAPIPLVLSTKTKNKIKCVEIQKEIFDLGKKSIEYNNLSDQIEIINQDAIEYAKNECSDSYDIITCNPPYFKINKESLLNNNDIKTNARHELLIKFNDVCLIARKLLKNGCSLYLVHRTERLADLIDELKKNNLQPKRIKFVYPKANVESNMVLIEATKNGKEGITVEPPIVAHNEDGSYTKEILDMFK